MAGRGRGRRKPQIKRAARSRITTLYDLSIEMAREGELELARRYLELARSVSMRYTLRIPRDLKMITCKGCLVPLIPGLTSRSRVRNGNTVITCLECGRIKRSPHGKRDENEH